MDFALTQYVKIEFLGQVNMYFGLGLEILTAIVLGASIGINREMKLKTAGFKTHILICLGATLYTAISILNLDSSGMNADPNRMAAQVVSGIGFLGAGAILRSKGGVYGLTTAAGIWVVAAIGVAIGSGYPFSATLFTFTILLVLTVLDPLYKFLRPESNYHLEVIGTMKIKNEVLEIINDAELNLEHFDVLTDDTKGRCGVNIYLKVSARELRDLVSRLKQVDEIELINFKLIKNLPHFDINK
jgi:putative Mg2+ transporter-C (MgtC) family protein